MMKSDNASTSTNKALLGISLVGAICFLLGLLVDPKRAWAGYLMGTSFFVSLALAGPVFLALLSLSGASWSTALLRIPEAMCKSLPIATLLGVGLFFGIHSLYEWSHTDAVAQDHLLQHKSSYLNSAGFLLRIILAFAGWIFGSRWILSWNQKVENAVEGALAKRVKVCALFLAFFAVSYSLLSFDWLMSLEPHWFSTMFALLRFGGLCSAGVAVIILFALLLEKQGALRGYLREEHLHDMGRLLFAATLFWAYCWFCQYMLIWYTNIPEETVHYVKRQEGAWWLLVQATLVLQWAVPFFTLLSRKACRSRTALARVAAVVLVGQAFELYVHVGPVLHPEEPVVGLWEIAPVAGAISLFFLFVLRSLSRTSPVPNTHPDLSESLSYQTP